MLATHLTLTALVLAAATVFGLDARARPRRDAITEAVLAAAACAAAIWLPRAARDVVLSLLVVVLVLAGAAGLLAAIATGAVVYALGRVVPGGSSVIVFAVGGVLVGEALLRALALRARIRRARAHTVLAPLTGDEVAACGQLRAPREEAPPRADAPMPAAPWVLWRFEHGGTSCNSTGSVQLVTPGGGLTLELADAVLDLSAHQREVPPAEVAPLARQLGIEALANETSTLASGTLRWAEAGDTLCVIGHLDRAAGAGSYRDSARTPILRGTATHKLLVADRSRDELLRDARRGALVAGAWLVAFAAVVLGQALGRA